MTNVYRKSIEIIDDNFFLNWKKPFHSKRLYFDEKFRQKKMRRHFHQGRAVG